MLWNSVFTFANPMSSVNVSKVLWVVGAFGLVIASKTEIADEIAEIGFYSS
jgi:hypothetical protein